MEDNKRESIYKIGDILEFDANVKGLVACVYQRAAHSEFLYGIWTWDGEVADCDEWLESDLITQAKKVDHMDISSLVGGEENNKPDYAMFFTASTVAQAADLRNENEKLKAENTRLLEALSESESKAHSRLDRITFLLHKVDELEDEVENVKDKLTADNARYLQSMTCSEKQMTEAAKRIHEAMEHLNVALCNS